MYPVPDKYHCYSNTHDKEYDYQTLFISNYHLILRVDNHIIVV